MSAPDGWPVVAGFCPMGCGATLRLHPGGAVVCVAPGCPRPAAAGEILADPEAEHRVALGEHGYDVLHPLRERLDATLLGCPLAAWLGGQAPAELPRGRFRAHWLGEDRGVSWEALP